MCITNVDGVFLSFSHARRESYIVYDFTTEPEYNWAGEMRILTILHMTMMNLRTWANCIMSGAERYGGVSIQGNELDLDVSSTQKRFLKTDGQGG